MEPTSPSPRARAPTLDPIMCQMKPSEPSQGLLFESLQ